MLAVLLAGAAEGQRRPALAEAIDLVRNAILMRMGQMFEELFVRPYEVRYRRLLWGFRIVFGFVLLAGVPQLERERVPMARVGRAGGIDQPAAVAASTWGALSRT
jgi:hypothetical protein